jgi:hypothetical protein
VEEFNVKFGCLLLSLAACAIPATAAPVTYDMTFTGGFFNDALNQEVPFAPSSGSFTYDSTGGFSNFIVLYDGAEFNFTAQANAPNICLGGSPCFAGTAADAFNLLTQDKTWESFETPLGPNTNTFLSLVDSSANTFYQTVPVFEGFQQCCGSPREGTYTIAAVPEPTTLPMLSVAALGLVGFVGFRLRKCAARPSH